MEDLKKYGIPESGGRPCDEALYYTALIYNICHARLSAFLRPYGLNPGKLNILAAIRLHGGKSGISQVDISHHLIVTPSNMTKMIDKLEKDGMVRRDSLPGDRRVNIVTVTPRAETCLDELWGRYLELMESFMEGIPEKAREQTAVLLKTWLGELLKTQTGYF